MPQRSSRVTVDAREMNQESSEALARLLQRPRMEVSPATGVEEQIRHLTGETAVPVTCLPKRGIEATLQLCRRISKQGLRPVPHISARLVADRAHLKRILQRLADLNLKEIFVIGGDSRKPVGPFPSSLALLLTIAELGFQFKEVGIAAYPEGHPFINDNALLEALQDKQPFASYMVTQLCLDPLAIATWISDIRREGVRLPVHIAIPGPGNRSKLLTIGLQIGIRDSIRFLRRHKALIGSLLRRDFRPDELVEGLAAYVGEPRSNIQGFHICTFNRVEASERWRQSMIGRLMR